MNIFPTHADPFKAAQALDDKRIVRQASEVVIMLGGVLPLLDLPSPYKATRQPGHKLNKWLLASADNFRWAAEYAYACNLLYRKIYGKTCVCAAELLKIRETFTRHAGRQGVVGNMLQPPRPAEFCNAARHRAMGLDFTGIPDVLEAYRQYLNARWTTDARAPTWQGRERPRWARFDRG